MINTLFYSSDALLIAKELANKEQLITSNLIDQLKHCIDRLQLKLEDINTTTKHFYIYKTLQNHLLPLTNIAFDKEGKRYNKSHLIEIKMRYNSVSVCI